MFNNKYCQLFTKLILPILAIYIVIPIIILPIIKPSSVDIGIVEIDFSIIPKWIFYISSYCVITFSCKQIIKSVYVKDELDLITNNIYGDIPTIYYILASIFLGISTIDLKNKPYGVQFKILNNSNKFKEILVPEVLDVEIEYIKEDDKKKSKIINLVIGDTYEIEYSHLPESVKNNRTILIKRKKVSNRDRIHSSNLIQLVQKVVEELKYEHNEYNLFLTTNPKTTKEIYEKVFNTCRDGFKLNIYDSDAKQNYKFNSNPSAKIKKI